MIDFYSDLSDTSFIVYFQNTPQQGINDYYRWFTPPWGWDWLVLQFWRWLNYTNVPIRDDWGSFQLPHQFTQAQKKSVLIIPQIPPIAEDPTQFRFLSPTIIKETLLSIQGLVLPNKAQCYVSCHETQSGKQEILFLLEIPPLQDTRRLFLLMKFVFLVKKEVLPGRKLVGR